MVKSLKGKVSKEEGIRSRRSATVFLRVAAAALLVNLSRKHRKKTNAILRINLKLERERVGMKRKTVSI